MARFFVEAFHTNEDCVEHLDSMMAVSHEMLNRFDWGCKGGQHVGLAVLEAQDEATLRRMLPTTIRGRARVVPLNKFSVDDVKSFHQD